MFRVSKEMALLGRGAAPEELAEAMPSKLTEDKVRELPPIFPF